MQTFVPYDDMVNSLKCLDNNRLNSQRSEARVILRGLLGEHDGWKDHPTMAMWQGYEAALANYVNHAEEAWKRRGYRSNQETLTPTFYGVLDLPWWWGDDRIHNSHRQALLTKLPSRYKVHFPDNKLHWRGYQYVWPDASEPGKITLGEWAP